jgi:ribonuclease P protein component
MESPAARTNDLERLRRRADFVAVAAADQVPTTAFVLQARRRCHEGPVRVGFTVSKKVGSSPERNRVRRRLKEVVRLSAPGRLRPGHDYVLVGRRAALSARFERMMVDFDTALQRIGVKRAPRQQVGKGERRARSRRGAASDTDS